MVPGTAGHAGNTYTIVVYGRYSTCDMCSMSDVFLVGPCDFALVGDEVESVYIVNVSVPVIVLSRSAVQFRFLTSSLRHPKRRSGQRAV